MTVKCSGLIASVSSNKEENDVGTLDLAEV